MIDDDPAVRDSLSELGAAIGLPVHSFESATDFFSAIPPKQPGCIVLDVRMPGMSGLELQERLATTPFKLPIIVVTGHGDVSMSVRALKNGAIDFIEKPFEPEQLAKSIRNAIELDGRNRENARIRADAETRLAGLSAEERDIMLAIAAGKTNGAIAEERDVSLRTVQFRRANIMKELGVESKADMIDIARAAGWLSE